MSVASVPAPPSVLSSGPLSVRHSAAEFGAILDALPIGVVVLSADGRPYYSNRAASQLANTALKPANDSFPSMFERLTIRRSSSGQLLSYAQLPIVRALRGESLVDHDLEIVLPDRVVPIAVSAGPLYDEDGQIRFALATFSDLTSQRRSEKSKQELEERYRLVVEHVADAFFIIDCDGRVVDANAAACRTLGYAAEQLKGLAVSQVMDSMGSEQVAELLMKLTSDHNIAMPIRLKKKDGTSCPAEAQLSGLRMLGEPALLVSARDITERLRMEQDLQQAHRFEAVGQLAAGVAHEINTPMQYIGDNTTFLSKTVERLLKLTDSFEELLGACENDELNPDQLKRCRTSLTAARVPFLRQQTPPAIEQALQGIAHVSSIIQGLKEFSHPGGDEQVSVDLNHVARMAATVSRNEWRYHSTLELELDEKLPNILGYPQELAQTLINLIVNAAHAIAERHGAQTGVIPGRIVIQTEEITGWVELRCSDNGAGIPEEIRHRVMDPFFTTKEVGKGTGQGLALVRNVVVERHGGQVTFASEVGRGTTFCLRLPLPGES